MSLISNYYSRDNLDPEHQLPDQEIYQVLEAVHLKEVLGATSLGQHQLSYPAKQFFKIFFYRYGVMEGRRM